MMMTDSKNSEESFSRSSQIKENKRGRNSDCDTLYCKHKEVQFKAKKQVKQTLSGCYSNQRTFSSTRITCYRELEVSDKLVLLF